MTYTIFDLGVGLGYMLLALSVPFAAYYSSLRLFKSKKAARIVAYIITLLFVCNLEGYNWFVIPASIYLAYSNYKGVKHGDITRDTVQQNLVEVRRCLGRIKAAIAQWFQRHRIIYLLLIIGLPFWGLVSFGNHLKEQTIREFHANPQAFITPIEQLVKRKLYDKAIGKAEEVIGLVFNQELNAAYEKAVLGKLKAITGDDLGALKKKRDLYQKIAPLKAEHNQTYSKLVAEYDTRKSASEPPENARYACKLAVKAKSKFPSEADFVGIARMTNSGTTTEVRGTVKLMNGIGAMIPNNYHCKFIGRRLIFANVDW